MAKQRPEPVDAGQLSNLRMTTGNEKKFTHIIDNKVVKQWVGIGWIELEKATKKDYETYPEVKR